MAGLPTAIELEFRDGTRSVPPHVVEILRGVETFRFTYEQAMAEGNKRMEARVVGDHMNSIIRTHFGTQR